MNNKKVFDTKTTVYLAILVALIVVLSYLGNFVKFITSINLTLVVLVLGVLLLGAKKGAILGLISGLLTFLYGALAIDGFTNGLFVNHPLLTFLTCVLKVTLAAFIGGVIYKVLEKKNKRVATYVTAGIIPIINTLVFIIGALLMYDSFLGWATEKGVSVLYYLIFFVAGTNFLIEFAVNVILTPVIFSVINALDKTR